MHSPVTEKRVDVLQSRAMKATSPESSAVHSRMVSVYCLLMRAIIIRESSFSLSPFLVQYASSTSFSSSTQKITVSLTGTTVLLGSFLVMLPESSEKNHMKNIFCVAPGYSSSFWQPILEQPPLRAFTQHCKFGHSAAAFLHLTDVHSIIIGGDIVNSEAAQGPFHIHAVLGIVLQTGLLHKPAGLCVRHWHLTLQSCGFLFLHLNILQLLFEWNLWLWQRYMLVSIQKTISF